MEWNGFEQQTGTCHDHEYIVVLPKKAAEGNPYLWRTEFFGAFPMADLAMLKKGYAVVYYGISDLYGCPASVALMADFQPFIEEKYAFHRKPFLFGFSRGGLYALHYAAAYPDRVQGLYLDAPVVDIFSWPGGCFSGIGGEKEWEECKIVWNQISHEAFLKIVSDAVRTLLNHQIPLILVAGGADQVVPFNENGSLLQKLYEPSGVDFRLIIKPDCDHHPHSLEDPAPIVDFILRNN